MTSETDAPTATPDGPALDENHVRLTATGRNDACPCGSGKKYKKCHLAEDQAKRTAALKTLEEEAAARAAAEAAEAEAEGEAAAAADPAAAARAKRQAARNPPPGGQKPKATGGKPKPMTRRRAV